MNTVHFRMKLYGRVRGEFNCIFKKIYAAVWQFPYCLIWTLNDRIKRNVHLILLIICANDRVLRLFLLPASSWIDVHSTGYFNYSVLCTGHRSITLLKFRSLSRSLYRIKYIRPYMVYNFRIIATCSLYLALYCILCLHRNTRGYYSHYMTLSSVTSSIFWWLHTTCMELYAAKCTRAI